VALVAWQEPGSRAEEFHLEREQRAVLLPTSTAVVRCCCCVYPHNCRPVLYIYARRIHRTASGAGVHCACFVLVPQSGTHRANALESTQLPHAAAMCFKRACARVRLGMPISAHSYLTSPLLILAEDSGQGESSATRRHGCLITGLEFLLSLLPLRFHCRI
jgi:hypothetical protein